MTVAVGRRRTVGAGPVAAALAAEAGLFGGRCCCCWGAGEGVGVSGSDGVADGGAVIAGRGLT